jgi:hypothetical protein
MRERTGAPVIWTRGKYERSEEHRSGSRGAHRPQLKETLAALLLELPTDDLARIAEAVPAAAVAGTRYAEPQMRMLDGERRIGRGHRPRVPRDRNFR